jgi:hypothetical protein
MKMVGNRLELEVSFASGDVNLAGTLALPDANAKRPPAFVLVHGSYPTNRDENLDFKFLSPKCKRETHTNFETIQLGNKYRRKNGKGIGS